ncbi:potassium transporter Kup [Ideonella sp.]|uniref:potassium transporter Kup n=1 Tax=Ideonella sp. TaxID=1929293 RepID=UPI002B48DECD|nr:potassium transporter Kup [Ideonella sp.]HJV70932.1 potassium transporter Kup [Ideonella sp.]
MTASTPATASATNAPAAAAPAGHLPRSSLGALTLAAIGVVYGDIGTSPLYTVKEIFSPAIGLAPTPDNLIGSVSVIFWALMLVVTLKYVTLILRADNRGEGGALALTALAAHAVAHKPRLRFALLSLGVFGATLFYGDSVITPAISVLGAMEGLEVVSTDLKAWVLPLSIGVLVGLFVVQRFGTAAVGRAFGPVIVLWFVVLAVSGIVHIAEQPGILVALNPLRAWHFLAGQGWRVFALVGAVVLAITGTEALYADMGHFGRLPIQLAWSGLVLPSLALNYLGQGALLMGDPAAIDNPFYRMFPSDWVLPSVGLATLAAIIASQAVISGAYSMTRQAIQLGYLPRMTVRFTSAREMGQIYMPAVNWALLAGVIGAVVGFGSSSALGGAYGIAVTLTMLITTVMTFFVVRDGWRLPAPLAWGATLFFLTLDTLLVASCAVKLLDGGWFPLALGLGLFLLMSTWARGRALVMDSIQRDGLDLAPFIASLDPSDLQRSTRTAVYPVANAEMVPQALLHNLKHYQVLHERNVILTVHYEEVPWVPEQERVTVKALGNDFWRVTLHFGFMETPDVPQALTLAEEQGLRVPAFETSYFLSRETVVPTPGVVGMAGWRERIFAAMTRNAKSAAEYFRLPDNTVVELGTRVQI